MPESYIKELRDTIRRLHGVESKHLESVPVKETYQDKTVWEGIVEVFELHGHPKATHAYAWSHDTDEGQKRHVAVLRIPPVVSPITAVRAAIAEEFRNFGTAEEE
jgi:hypothetical protein